jgi:hypothetical protein
MAPDVASISGGRACTIGPSSRVSGAAGACGRDCGGARGRWDQTVRPASSAREGGGGAGAVLSVAAAIVL